MPYKVGKHSSCPKDHPFAAMKEDGSKVFGCHATKSGAVAQVRALYANEASSKGGDPKSPKQRLETQLLVAEEAVFDDDRQEAEVTIVRPGISDNNLDHTVDAIRVAVEEGIWDGSRMFIDHGEPGNMERMPWRRKLSDLVSKVLETWVGPKGEAKARVKFMRKDFYDFAKEAKDVIGLSMATWFEGGKYRKDGQVIQRVDRYTKNRSIDWVAFPAAGGAIDKFLPAMESIEVDWDELTPEMLKEHRPDLVAALAPAAAALESADGTANGSEEKPPAQGASQFTEAELDRLIDVRVNAAVEAKRNEWESQSSKKETVKSQVSEFVSKAGLPKPTQERIVAQFSGSTEFAEEAVQSAIDSAFTELEAVGFKKVKVTNNGQSGALDSEERKTTATVEEMAAAGFDDLPAMESRLFYEPAGKAS